MTKQELGVHYHITGYNCSQAVLGAFCKDLGLEHEAAMQVASGFGGGMRCGEVCGAVTGALMALGLKYGQIEAEDQATKMRMYQKATLLQEKFKDKYGTTWCKELLDYDITTPEGFEIIKAKGLSRSLCDTFIKEAITLVEDMLMEA